MIFVTYMYKFPSTYGGALYSGEGKCKPAYRQISLTCFFVLDIPDIGICV